MKIDLTNIKLQKEEVSDIKFVTKEEFLEMAKNNIIVKSVYNRYNVIKDKLKKDW
jgi:isopentenyldiphosphate isomerase